MSPSDYIAIVSGAVCLVIGMVVGWIGALIASRRSEAPTEEHHLGADAAIWRD